MKRMISILLVMAVLSGCTSGAEDIDKVVALRSDLQNADGCEFDANVTVDYGDSFVSFGLHCRNDNQQNMEITVLEPESISGITCKISGGKGQLTFDEKAVAFEMIADGLITPVGVPWLIMKTIWGGYISSVANEETGLFVRLDDSYNGSMFNVDLWLGKDKLPQQAELVWEGKRIVSMSISNFKIL